MPTAQFNFRRVMCVCLYSAADGRLYVSWFPLGSSLAQDSCEKPVRTLQSIWKSKVKNIIFLAPDAIRQSD